jgi:hypothetical protein
MYITSIAGSSNNFTFPRDKISSSDAIKVTIGAENFGRLVKITDTTVVISSSATSTIIYLITTVSSVTCDEMLDIIALRPSISKKILRRCKN